MPASPTLAGRAALAVLLLVGFYALAFALVGALLYLPYAELRYLDRVHGRVLLFCGVGVFLVLRAIAPRRDRFIPPGPALDAAEHPELFAMLREVAAATGQAMPAEVYLVPDMNAFVAQRGGVMGIGSRRVMGLGLPLMQTLTVAQLRAVIAHEFGHYHGGDTALGPWIYKTRAALGRTLHELSGHSTMLRKPFEWYGTAFLRITHAISRRQEYAADALAARVVGRVPLVEGLRTVYGASDAFGGYWRTELGPALARGYQPPIADGFRRYLAAPTMAESVRATTEQAMAQESADPYDTHPTLAERIAALGEQPEERATADDPAAVTLLRDLPAMERALLTEVMPADALHGLQAVAWEEVPECVWAPTWREQAQEHAAALAGVTPVDIIPFGDDGRPLVVRLGLASAPEEVTQDHLRQAAHILGAALATALHARGWTLHALPGETIFLERDGHTVAPFELLYDLWSGDLPGDDWRARCEAAGIAAIDLGAREELAATP
ncbi:MAG TPA: M48 family metallopeptidase [Gemmatimonadaceae bacterium]|nr:M48 family metallopeptidase [Gemmatimonadaceae bacterium]